MKTIKNITFALLLNVIAAGFVFAQDFNYNQEGIRIGQNQFKDVPSKQIGPVNLQAALATQEQYESNVFWTPNSARKSDSINVTSPQFLLSLPVGLDDRNIIQVMYLADLGTFSKYSSQNYVNQNAVANADFKLPFGYIDFQNDFTHTVDRASTEFTNQVKRNENKASTTVGVDFNSQHMKNYTDLFSHFSGNSIST